MHTRRGAEKNILLQSTVTHHHTCFTAYSLQCRKCRTLSYSRAGGHELGCGMVSSPVDWDLPCPLWERVEEDFSCLLERPELGDWVSPVFCPFVSTCYVVRSTAGSKMNAYSWSLQYRGEIGCGQTAHKYLSQFQMGEILGRSRQGRAQPHQIKALGELNRPHSAQSSA